MYILYRNTSLAALILMVCVSMKDKCAVKRKLLSLFPHWIITFMESGCLSIYSKHIQALGYCESFWFNECHGKSALDKSEMFASTITSERFIFTQKYSSSPSPALPQWTLCVCVCMHMSSALFVSVLFFQMACAVLPQYTGHFFLLLVEGPCVHSCYHATCNPLPLTFLCVVFLRSPLCPLSAVTVHRWPVSFDPSFADSVAFWQTLADTRLAF